MQNLQIVPEELKKFVESSPHLVMCKRSERHPELRVIKYKNTVFYDNLWDEHPYLKECRGLVVDDDYNVVVRPFTKIFNYGENGTKIDRDELCTVVRKINGFLGVATWWNDKIIYSTTGSLDSKYVDLAKKCIEPFKQPMMRSGSYCFEIVDESDPHIIKEGQGAYLLGYRDGSVTLTEQQLDYELNDFEVGNFRPEWRKDVRFSDIVKEVKTCKHEGFVVYGQESGTALKLKSPYYLTSKLFARMKPDKLYKFLTEGKSFKGIDEDYAFVVNYLMNNVDYFITLSEQEKIEYVQKFINWKLFNV